MARYLGPLYSGPSETVFEETTPEEREPVKNYFAERQAEAERRRETANYLNSLRMRNMSAKLGRGPALSYEQKIALDDAEKDEAKEAMDRASQMFTPGSGMVPGIVTFGDDVARGLYNEVRPTINRLAEMLERSPQEIRVSVPKSTQEFDSLLRKYTPPGEEPPVFSSAFATHPKYGDPVDAGRQIVLNPAMVQQDRRLKNPIMGYAPQIVIHEATHQATAMAPDVMRKATEILESLPEYDRLYKSLPEWYRKDPHRANSEIIARVHDGHMDVPVLKQFLDEVEWVEQQSETHQSIQNALTKRTRPKEENSHAKRTEAPGSFQGDRCSGCHPVRAGLRDAGLRGRYGPPDRQHRRQHHHQPTGRTDRGWHFLRSC